MGELWKIFVDTTTGRELCAYTIRGTFDGEEQATREMLAHENGLQPEQIKTTIERRATNGS